MCSWQKLPAKSWLKYGDHHFGIYAKFDIQLFKDQTLGIGSYGKVCRARYGSLPCAAKLIHETLFDPEALNQIAPEKEHRLYPLRGSNKNLKFSTTWGIQMPSNIWVFTKILILSCLFFWWSSWIAAWHNISDLCSGFPIAFKLISAMILLWHSHFFMLTKSSIMISPATMFYWSAISEPKWQTLEWPHCV